TSLDVNHDGVPDECASAHPSDFRRGDANQDSKVSISDAIAILQYLFTGEFRLLCLDAADADDNAQVSLSDSIVILRYLFLGQGPLPEPFGQCGKDTAPDALGCEQFRSC